MLPTLRAEINGAWGNSYTGSWSTNTGMLNARNSCTRGDKFFSDEISALSWDDHAEFSALSLFAVSSNYTTMILHHLPANGQTNTSTLINIPVVQSLEYSEYFFTVQIVKPDAVVRHANLKVRESR